LKVIKAIIIINRTEYPFEVSENLACSAFYLIGLACGAFCFIKNLACGVFFSSNLFSFLNRDAFDLKFLIMSTNSLVMKMIRTLILNDHNDVVCIK